ncbi:MAG: nitrilase-related carbon-nitrogen hydrolase, partial [Bacteroidota bacterium]
MKQILNVTLVEMDLIWEDPEANRASLEKKIVSHSSPTDIFILPEMFTCGFTMNPDKVAEPMFGETYIWLQDLSAQTKTAICGSIPVMEKDKYYNRFLFVAPSEDL